MPVPVEKISGGFNVDGLELKGGKCGCTSIAKCCYSMSKVKMRDGVIEFNAKMTDPDTLDTYDWSYTVRKDGTTVKVAVEDARDKTIYSGFIPPSVDAWEARGWEVVEKSGEREDGVVWRCSMCKWLYKENEEGMSFDDLPENWKCPKCRVGKNYFERIG